MITIDSIDIGGESGRIARSSTERAFADQIARRADANGDGRVSSDEFERFLADLMRSLDADIQQERASAADATAGSTRYAVPVAPAAGTPAGGPSPGEALLHALDALGKAR